jgi:hypothetical protein
MPEFAVAILDSIIKNDYEVVGLSQLQTNQPVEVKIKILSCKGICTCS